jgi:hypothetical protein
MVGYVQDALAIGKAFNIASLSNLGNQHQSQGDYEALYPDHPFHYPSENLH